MGEMTQDLFRTDAYLSECSATVTAITPQGMVLDRTVFCPLGRGQAGDARVLILAEDSEITLTDTRKSKLEDGNLNDEITHLPAPELLDQLLNQEQTSAVKLTVGDTVTALIDWARRHRLMRFHTATHLLCHLVPQLVNGSSITPDYARLDFNMTDALDKELLSAGLTRLVAAAHPISVGAITGNPPAPAMWCWVLPHKLRPSQERHRRLPLGHQGLTQACTGTTRRQSIALTKGTNATTAATIWAANTAL